MAAQSLVDSATTSQIAGISTHQYQPPSDSGLQIRLLTLDTADSWASEIRCRLIKLDLKTKFEALSYTWEGGVENPSFLMGTVAMSL
jgi:hypothetical protein